MIDLIYIVDLEEEIKIFKDLIVEYISNALEKKNGFQRLL